MKVREADGRLDPDTRTHPYTEHRKCLNKNIHLIDVDTQKSIYLNNMQIASTQRRLLRATSSDQIWMSLTAAD